MAGDWEKIWWLRPGDLAATFDDVSLVFRGDEGSLWRFELQRRDGSSTEVYWDYRARSFPPRNEGAPPLPKRLAESLRAMIGPLGMWEPPGDHQRLLDTIATRMKEEEWVTGKRLRAKLGWNKEQLHAITDPLQPRYVRERLGDEGDAYSLSLPGLLVSSSRPLVLRILDSTLATLQGKFERDPDVQTFTLDELVTENGFEFSDRKMICWVVSAADLRLGGTGVFGDRRAEFDWSVPRDIEEVIACQSGTALLDYFQRPTTHRPRPWPTAPVRISNSASWPTRTAAPHSRTSRPRRRSPTVDGSGSRPEREAERSAQAEAQDFEEGEEHALEGANQLQEAEFSATTDRRRDHRLAETPAAPTPRKSDGPRASQGEAVRWLHISDFHIKAGTHYDSRVVLDGIEELVREGRDHQPFDFVVATGDIAYSGQTEEYTNVEGFFDRLLKAVGLGRERLVVVPGNHDVNRGRTRGLARTLKTEKESQEYFGPDYPRHDFVAQKEFRNWHDDYFKAEGRVAPTDTTCGPLVSMTIRGQRVHVLPVNTALFARDDHDHGKLWIGRRAVRESIATLRDAAGLRIVAMHHPFEWLHYLERRRVQAEIQAAADIIMTGHLHDAEAGHLTSASTEVVTVSAGAAYQGSQWPCSLFFGAADATSIRLRPFRYADNAEQWVLDTSIFPNSKAYEGVFSRPRRDRGAARGRVSGRESATAAGSAKTSAREGGHDLTAPRADAENEDGPHLTHSRESTSGHPAHSVDASQGNEAEQTSQDAEEERREHEEGDDDSEATTVDLVDVMASILARGPNRLSKTLAVRLECGEDRTQPLARRVAMAIDDMGSGPKATRTLVDTFYEVWSELTAGEAADAGRTLGTIQALLLEWLPRRYDEDRELVRVVRRQPLSGARAAPDAEVDTDNDFFVEIQIAGLDERAADLEPRSNVDDKTSHSSVGRYRLPSSPTLDSEIQSGFSAAQTIAKGLASQFPGAHDGTPEGHLRFARKRFEFLRRRGRDYGPRYLVLPAGGMPVGALRILKAIFPALRLVEKTGKVPEAETDLVNPLISLFRPKSQGD